jgi:ferredoxin/flavodoxin
MTKKTKIYYFSATGNSYYIAKNLGEKLGDAEVISIPKAIKEGINISGEKIGIVFPVYCWGVPRIIKTFVEKLPNIKDNYVFAVCNGGGFPGGTLKQLAQLLNKKGISIKAGFTLKMPGNYIPLYNAFSLEKQKALIAKSKIRFEEIALTVQAEAEHKLEINSWIVNFLFKQIYNLSLPNFPKIDKCFSVDDNCNGCDICTKICPVENIELKDRKPVWKHNCEHCLACLQWCPKEAIQFKNKTQKRTRYHNPEVKLQELL